ncbi:hypothetical protein K402DRAFT_267627 [Aulographum hederae CBS 113979]|uniref:Uncharacterized protein n=1 Tax=Aulographum hederae CBS 113979 TaxID=1176131 RepID=A0A6G1GIE7_9PEZI|nr:hypothetical protein K402DRAFT_267627 [Aulographum hederae CBS 113979]
MLRRDLGNPARKRKHAFGKLCPITLQHQRQENHENEWIALDGRITYTSPSTIPALTDNL